MQALRKLRALEEELRVSIINHKKQLLHIGKQKSRLQKKEARSELIDRYKSDYDVLMQRVELQQKALSTVWRSKALLQYKNHFREVMQKQPTIQMPESLEQESDSFYQGGVKKLRKYLKVVHSLRKELNAPHPAPPPVLTISKDILEEVEQERLQAIHNFDLLIKRVDRFIDQLLYIQDWRSTKNLGQTLTIAEEELESSLSQVSASLGELHSLTTVDSLLENESLHDDLEQQLRRLREMAEDMEARVEAEQEVERMLKAYAHKQQQKLKR